VLAENTSDFLALVQTGTTSAWKNSIVPHKISGTTITYGDNAQVPELGPISLATAIPAVRLSSGDYILMGANALALPVMRSNGDAINKRGSIAIPNMSTPTAFPLANVSSSRIVMLGSTQGTTVSASTQQLRLLSVEIAA
jgi:hypothetical protein